MIFKPFIFGLFAIVLSQDVKEKGNLDDLITELFPAPPNTASQPTQNDGRSDVEKVNKQMQNV